MPRLATNDTKDRFTRQVVTVHQNTSGSDLASHQRVYLYALDGSRIGFCDMMNYEDEIDYND